MQHFCIIKKKKANKNNKSVQIKSAIFDKKILLGTVKIISCFQTGSDLKYVQEKIDEIFDVLFLFLLEDFDWRKWDFHFYFFFFFRDLHLEDVDDLSTITPSLVIKRATDAIVFRDNDVDDRPLYDFK